MKITDVSLTLFEWRDIPPTTYGQMSRAAGTSQLGLLEIETDGGLRGHAFLGSAMRGAHLDGQSLIQFLKPLLVGQNALDRERLYQEAWKRNRNTTIRAIGAVIVGSIGIVVNACEDGRKLVIAIDHQPGLGRAW